MLVVQSASKGPSTSSGPIWGLVWWGKAISDVGQRLDVIMFKNITRLTGIWGRCSWDFHGSFSDSTACTVYATGNIFFYTKCHSSQAGCLVLTQGLSAGDSVEVGTEKATENVESGKGSEEHCVAR